jgi:DNA-binding SARP family transcriptional activator
LAHGAMLAARQQQAHALERVARLLKALAGRSTEAISETTVAIGGTAPWHVSYLAEVYVDRLHLLDEAAIRIVVEAASRHPARWRVALRKHIDARGTTNRPEPARLLEHIGEREDVARLRKVAKSFRRASQDAELGRLLARRVAHRINVADQGRVVIHAGERLIPGSSVRRKVLALMCLLLARPDMALTRDQVLDALWPDLDPSIAVNSLNQTVYFLRRVFEEDYVEDLSPGYLHHDSDVLWLDPELVSSQSVRCAEFIRSLDSQPTPDQVDRLVDLYHGRFALDFEYEEWAAAYRDSMHASYLEIVERSVLADVASGHYDRGIRIARRALEIAPEAEQIEVTLLRLYRLTGAHSAAAEQYSHYAGALRADLGVDAPALDSL